MTSEGDKPRDRPRSATQTRDGRVRFRVVLHEGGLSLRQLLCRRFADLRPQSAADLIKAGGVYVDNIRIRLPSLRVASGERLTVYRAAANSVVLDPKDLRIIHRDPEFFIIDKPAGVPPSSTRASSRGTVAQALVHRLSGEGILRPYVGPIRPIPTGASGLILYTMRGQDAVSHQNLYLDADLETTDLLLVTGDAPERLRCEEPMLMTRSGRLTVCSPEALGATPSVTDFRCLPCPEDLQGEGLSLLEARAMRALGAQAAVHAASLGFPVRRQQPNESQTETENDAESERGNERGNEGGNESETRAEHGKTADAPPNGALFLHRARIELVHPRSGERLSFEATPPRWTER